MRTTSVIAMAILLPIALHAQYKGRITGNITDAINKYPLEGATISVLDSISGIYIKHAVSNNKGEFAVTALPLDIALQVIITFAGYRDTSAVLLINAKTRTLNTGNWTLAAGDELDSVVVTARKAPFVVKKDTLEFNATAFKTLPTDMVQDLLQKLPGVSVDEEGNVTVNGQKVDKIKVDGRDFFNPNIKTALENLPGAIIEKVQVTPSREDAQANTSIIDPVDRNVTINLQLKKANRKGKFGHIAAGYGTQQLYNGDAFLNAFNNSNRYSAIAQASKGNDGGYLGQSGNWGLNANQRISKKMMMDASYQGNTSKRNGTSATERQNILPDSSFLYNNISATHMRKNEHLFNSNINVDIDTLQRMFIRPELFYSENNNDLDNNAVSATMNGEAINSQNNIQRNKSKTAGFNNSISYFRSSRNYRTTLSVNWNIKTETGTGTQRNRSENTFGNGKDTIDQHGASRDSRFSNNIGIILNQRIAKSLTAIVQYSFSQSNDRTTKNVYNADNRLDSNFSIDNKNTMMTHLPNASIGYSGKKIEIELGAGWTFLQQQNKIVRQDSVIKINQKNFAPRISASWMFARRSSITAQYSVSSSAPTADQLAPVADNANPLYITKGNPNLQSSFTHNLNIELQYYSSDFQWFGSVRGAGRFSDHPIVNDNFFDDSGRQVSTWRNAAMSRNVTLNLTLGRSLRVGEWNWQFNAEVQFDNSKEPGFVNTQLNNVSNTQFSPGVKIDMNYAALFFMGLDASVESNKTAYSLSGINNLSYDNKRVVFYCKWLPIKKLQIHPSVSYYYNAQLPKEFQRAQTLLNGTINYYLLKNNQLSLGVMVNDILNNGVTTTRRITPTAIETTQVNAIRRYGMFTVRYRLSQFGGMM